MRHLSAALPARCPRLGAVLTVALLLLAPAAGGADPTSPHEARPGSAEAGPASPAALASLSDVELAQRAARLDRMVAAQWAEAGRAGEDLRAAVVNVASLRRRRGEILIELSALRSRAGERAVELYISASDDPVEHLLRAEDPNQAGVRRALSTTLAATDLTLEDRLRAADADLAELERAVKRAEAEQRRVADRAALARGEADELVRQQVALTEALRDRVAALSAHSAGLDGDEGEILELLSATAGPPGGAGPPRVLAWPAAGPVTSEFGTRWGRPHRGIDIGGDEGEPVLAAGAGTILAAEYLSGYGLHVIIDHGGGLSTLYAHLSAVEVSPGQRLTEGQPLGAIGMTGFTTGPHLHFEARQVGEASDPRTLLPPGRAVAAE
jgi:murein DD-endopeptidase MepM/ murein hydrolase activator NlpD